LKVWVTDQILGQVTEGEQGTYPVS